MLPLPRLIGLLMNRFLTISMLLPSVDRSLTDGLFVHDGPPGLRGWPCDALPAPGGTRTTPPLVRLLLRRWPSSLTPARLPLRHALLLRACASCRDARSNGLNPHRPSHRRRYRDLRLCLV